MNSRDALKLLSLGAVMEFAPKFAEAEPVMPKALIFDTLGTVVDWRGSIIVSKDSRHLASQLGV